MAVLKECLLLFLSLQIYLIESVSTPPKIVIIGGGISGLSAAAYLEAKGGNYTNYVILEATDRVGGRVYTQTEVQDGTEFPLELGAGWIHGDKGNVIYDIAKDNDLLKTNSWSQEANNPRFTEYAMEFRMKDARKLNLLFTVQPIYAQWTALEDKMDEFYQGELPSGFNENSSMEDYILAKFYEKFNGTIDWATKRALVETVMNYAASDNGCHSMKELSLKYIGAYQTLDGEDTPLPRGFITVVNVVKKNIPDSKIKLNNPVRTIEYSESGGKVKVITKSGASFDADHVIVTPSLGYLKRNAATMFYPTLAQDKMAAIQRMGYGVVSRIYLEFENLNFITDRDVGEIYFVRDPKDLTDSKLWWHKVFNCYVEDVPKGNMLTCWLTGLQSEEMEKKSDQEVKTKMQELLQTFLGTTVPAPLKMIRSMWGKEEYYQGSYSYIRAGSSPDDIRTLAKPINQGEHNKPIVLFAGEATHDKFYSTVHGAYLSGEREAKKIISYTGPAGDAGDGGDGGDAGDAKDAKDAGDGGDAKDAGDVVKFSLTTVSACLLVILSQIL